MVVQKDKIHIDNAQALNYNQKTMENTETNGVPKRHVEYGRAIAAASVTNSLALIRAVRKDGSGTDTLLLVTQNQQEGGIRAVPVAKLFDNSDDAILEYETPEGGEILDRGADNNP